MAKERLSKLQKWVLQETFENEVISREWIRTYFGIDPPESCQEWLRASFGIEPPKSFREAKYYVETKWKPLTTK